MQQLPHSTCPILPERRPNVVCSSTFTAVALRLAKEARTEWIFHIATDELIYAGGRRGHSLRYLVMYMRGHDIYNLMLPTYDAIPEQASVQDPFTEASEHVFRGRQDKLIWSLLNA